MELAKVYLVGAGPGHPKLLTLRAAELLRTADVVVYDRLVQEEVLALAKPSAERIFMGKTPGRHESRQEEVHQVLASKAREGKTVVRLKGGDPFLFGRGGEEAEFLAELGIPFEVIPGVSSALAAPLCAGIAVTHRDAASSVAIITGHEATRDQGRVDWQALTRMDTLVFLMAVANVSRVAESLIAAGKSPDTPAAMIQMAFWHDERVVTATLGSIARAIERAGIKPPATLVVGEVVRLREKLKVSRRDLQRRADDHSRFEPSPGADEVLRLATGAAGSQLLGFALDAGLFDRLEQPRTIDDLTAGLGLRAAAVEELLDALVVLGLLESTSAGYRNLEIASRYLTNGSDQSLRGALLEEIALSTSWRNIADYARNGEVDRPPSGNGGGPPQDAASEALARFMAPVVVDKVDFGAHGPILHIGWGGGPYAEVMARRWPGVSFTTCNPFRTPDPVAALETPGGPFGCVLLSGAVASCRRDQFGSLLTAATAPLGDRGLLVLHDAFLPGTGLPPVHVILGALARQLAHGDCRTWSTLRLTEELRGLGWAVTRTEPVAAGTFLVTAERQARS
jgi:uroporphyrin-III C-methyltransferase